MAENVEIAHLAFERDIASGNLGYNATAVEFGRSVHVHDLFFKDMGFASVVATYGESYLVESIYCDKSIYNGAFSTASGGFIGGWSMRALTIRNVVGRDVNNIAISYEGQLRGILIDGAILSSTQTSVSFPLFMSFTSAPGATKVLAIQNVQMQSVFTDQIGIAGAVPDVLENLTVWKNVGVSSLASASGVINYEGVQATRRKSFSSTFVIPTTAVTNMAIPIPSGWYRSIRVFMSTLTGVTSNTKILANGGGGESVFASLVAGQTVALTIAGAGTTLIGLERAGSGGFNNNLTGGYEKTFYITTDGTTPAGAYGRIEIDYFPLGVSAGVNDLSNAEIQAISGLASTSNLVVGGGASLTKILKGSVTINPASVAANTVASQNFTLTGAVTGDALILNPPTGGLTAGLLVLQVRVSAANQITVVFYNTTGAPIDQASGSWTYQLVR